MRSIWASVEIGALSRDFDYTNYIYLHKKMAIESKPISESACKSLNDWFNETMENENGR